MRRAVELHRNRKAQRRQPLLEDAMQGRAQFKAQFGPHQIDDIAASLASAQTAMETAKDRHQQTQKTLTDLLQSIETSDPNEVGVQILTLQTNIQASLQTTAMLSKLTLVNLL